MKRNLTILAVLAFITLSATPVLAEGFYVGAGLGNTFFSSSFEIEDVTDEVQDIDENSTAWKIFGGFAGNRFLSVEGGYRDFGNIESDIEGANIKSKVKGWDFDLMGRVQVSIVDIFAKAGVMFWDNEVTFGSATASETGTDFIWGLGAGVRLGKFGVRLEWESLVQDEVDNLSVVSLGATYGF